MKKNDIPVIIKAKKIPVHDAVVQVLFDKGLTSVEKSNLIALGVAIHLELGHDIHTIHSANAGEIIGLVGEEKYIDDILKYHIVKYHTV